MPLPGRLCQPHAESPGTVSHTSRPRPVRLSPLPRRAGTWAGSLSLRTRRSVPFRERVRSRSLIELTETGDLVTQPGPDSRIVDGSSLSGVRGEADDHDAWFTGYERTFVERDPRDLSRVTDLGPVRRVLGLRNTPPGHQRACWL